MMGRPGRQSCRQAGLDGPIAPTGPAVPASMALGQSVQMGERRAECVDTGTIADRCRRTLVHSRSLAFSAALPD